jgi:hypothetical protein
MRSISYAVLSLFILSAPVSALSGTCRDDHPDAPRCNTRSTTWNRVSGPVNLLPPNRRLYKGYDWHNDAKEIALISYTKYSRRKVVVRTTKDKKKLAAVKKLKDGAAKLETDLRKMFGKYSIKRQKSYAQVADQVRCANKSSTNMLVRMRNGVYREVEGGTVMTSCDGVSDTAPVVRPDEQVYLDRQIRNLWKAVANMEYWILQGEEKVTATKKALAQAELPEKTPDVEATPKPPVTEDEATPAKPPEALEEPAAVIDPTPPPAQEEEEEKIDLLPTAKALAKDVEDLRGIKNKLLAQAEAAQKKITETPLSENIGDPVHQLADDTYDAKKQAKEIQSKLGLPEPTETPSPPPEPYEADKILDIAKAGYAMEQAEREFKVGNLDAAITKLSSSRVPDSAKLTAKIRHLQAAKSPSISRVQAAQKAYKSAGESSSAAALAKTATSMSLPDKKQYKTEKYNPRKTRLLKFKNGVPNTYFSFLGGTIGGDVSEFHFMRMMVFSTRLRMGIGSALVSRYVTKHELAPTGLEVRKTNVTNFFPLELAFAPLNVRVWHNTVFSPQFYASFSGWGIASSRGLSMFNSKAASTTTEWGLRVPLGAFIGLRVAQLKIKVPNGKLANIAETPFTGFNKTTSFVGVDFVLGGMFGLPKKL